LFSAALDPKLGDLHVREHASAKLREWVRELKATRAASTVKNIANTLTTMLEDAMAEEWIAMPGNPMKHPGVRKELPAVKLKGASDRVYLTRPQAEALLRCPEVPEHRRVRYMLALTSGMRDGELAGLNWADIDLEAKPPRVEITKALALRGVMRGLRRWATPRPNMPNEPCRSTSWRLDHFGRGRPKVGPSMLGTSQKPQNQYFQTNTGNPVDHQVPD
jgi:integrase